MLAKESSLKKFKGGAKYHTLNDLNVYYEYLQTTWRQ